MTENVYNKQRYDKFKKYKYLINPDNSEDCSSNLLKVVRDIELRDGKIILYEKYKNIIYTKYTNEEKYEELQQKLINIDKELSYKLKEVNNILISLENFVLSLGDVENGSKDIIKSTFGYYLADEVEKERLLELIGLIKENIDRIRVEEKTPYRKSLLGIKKVKELLKFVEDNFDTINNASYETLIEMISNEIVKSDESRIASKIIKSSAIPILLEKWLSGCNYIELLNFSKSEKLTITRGKKDREIKMKDIITLCNVDFGYISLAIIQSLIEILENKKCSSEISEKLNEIILKIRYGLPDQTSIYVYELGFSDRIISQKISKILLGYNCMSKEKTKYAIKQSKDLIEDLLINYPTYFSNRLKEI